MGCALKPAYQSHFVLTTQDGNVYNKETQQHLGLKICNGMLLALVLMSIDDSHL
jgi:hypothetical protein